LISHARRASSALLLAAVLFGCSSPALARKPARKQAARTSLVERVGTTGILQLEAESFRDLSTRQKTLAYYLSQASVAIDPIIYDQLSRYGLRQKAILEAVVSHPDVMKAMYNGRALHREADADETRRATLTRAGTVTNV